MAQKVKEFTDKDGKALFGKAGFVVRVSKKLVIGLLFCGFLGSILSVGHAMDEAQVEQSFLQFQKEWIKKLNTEGKYGEKSMRVEKVPGDDSQFIARYDAVKEASGSHIKKTSQAATPYIGTMHYEIWACSAGGKTAEEARQGPFNCELRTDTTEIFRFNGTKWVY